MSELRSLAAAHCFRLDIKGAEVRGALSAVGVFPVLLKGRAFAELLYPDPVARAYEDIDLLIDPTRLEAAGDVLKRLGFSQPTEDTPAAQTDLSVGTRIGALGDTYGQTWIRDDDGIVVDLHDGLPQVAADKGKVWRLINDHLDVMEVGGTPAQVLDRPASALLVALHAGHHGPAGGRPLADLEQAVSVFDIDCWREAADLARELGADAPFGAGLGLTSEGRSIAQQLGISSEPSSGLSLKWSGAPWGVAFMHALGEQPGLKAKVSLFARVVWPTPASMRRSSRLARRGAGGLATAYLLRTLRLAGRLPALIGLKRTHARQSG